MYRQQQFESLLAGKRILIAGYGREGRSTHALLRRLTADSLITVAQNDEEAAAALHQAQSEGRAYHLVVKSPGIPTMKLEGLCERECVTSQTDLFLQVYGDRTVGITGTKGKSTTASLIHHILRHGMGKDCSVLLAGNIGIPLFDIAEGLDEQSIVVAELSCHQLENIRRAPHVGVVLNLYDEHLDHYRDYSDYQMAKMQMMLKQQAGDHCFYCADNETLALRVEELRPSIASTLHPYSLHDAEQAAVDRLPTHLQGDHNRGNIRVAKLVSDLMGVGESLFAQALGTFEGLCHRMERVGTYCGITFYNDSISTIPQATIAAVETLQRVDTLILGGYDRGIDYSTLCHYLASPTQAGGGIRNIVFVGKAGRRIYDTMASKNHSTLEGRHLLMEDDYSKIVDWCFAHTEPGKICLLSPSAASYDSFKNFEERGDTFCKLIRNHR